MSDDFLHLLLLVGVIYLAEIASILPEPRTLLVQLVGRRFALTGSGFVVRNPLPWSLTFALEDGPLLPGQDGVAAYQAHRPTPRRPAGWGHRYLRYDSIRETAVVGADLLVNGELFLRHASEPAARASAAWLERLVRLPREARPAAIDDELTRTLDVEAARRRLEQVLAATRGLRLASTLLFVHTAATLALFAVTEWALPRWPWFVIVFGVLVGAVVWLFATGHRALYPGLRGDRWLKTFVVAANFLSACRAGEALARDGLAGFHRLTIIRLLGSPTQLRALARTALLELRYPPPWQRLPPSAEAGATLAAHRALVDARLTAMLTDQGVDPRQLTAPPLQSTPTSAAYCPRCSLEYRAPTTTCPDCEVALVPFPTDASGRAPDAECP